METVLSIPIYSLLPIGQEMIGVTSTEKVCYSDYGCRINDDMNVLVEMQNEKEEDENYRFAIYLFRTIQTHLNRGGDYETAKGCVIVFRNHQISHAYGNLPYDIAQFRYASDGALFCDNYCILFVDLTNLNDIVRKTVKEMSTLERLRVYLKYSHEEAYSKIITEIIQTEGGIRKMEKAINDLVIDPTYYFQYMKNIDERIYRDKCKKAQAKYKAEKQRRMEEEQKRIEEEQKRKQEECKRKEEEQRRRQEECKRKEEEQKRYKEEKQRFDIEKERNNLIELIELMDQGYSKAEAELMLRKHVKASINI